jgi:hypothetical protein
MPLASTLLVLLKRGATCRSPSSSKDRPATSIRQGLTRSPTSVAALVRNSLENLVLLGQMRSIRGYYRGLVPEAGEFFDPPEADVLYQAAVETIGLRASPGQALFTGASVVAAITSILGGAGLALLAGRLGHLGDGAALTVGAPPPCWCLDCISGTSSSGSRTSDAGPRRVRPAARPGITYRQPNRTRAESAAKRGRFSAGAGSSWAHRTHASLPHRGLTSGQVQATWTRPTAHCAVPDARGRHQPARTGRPLCRGFSR